jgi:hypothetical protein
VKVWQIDRTSNQTAIIGDSPIVGLSDSREITEWIVLNNYRHDDDQYFDKNLDLTSTGNPHQRTIKTTFDLPLSSLSKERITQLHLNKETIHVNMSNHSHSFVRTSLAIASCFAPTHSWRII